MVNGSINVGWESSETVIIRIFLATEIDSAQVSNNTSTKKESSKTIRTSDWIRGLINHFILLFAFSYVTFSENSKEVLAFGSAWKVLLDQYSQRHDLRYARCILD